VIEWFERIARRMCCRCGHLLRAAGVHERRESLLRWISARWPGGDSVDQSSERCEVICDGGESLGAGGAGAR
jgi:hypothetical protein